jgi:hypothetical protein
MTLGRYITEFVEDKDLGDVLGTTLASLWTFQAHRTENQRTTGEAAGQLGDPKPATSQPGADAASNSFILHILERVQYFA